MNCEKKPYKSIHAARAAHRQVPFRIKVYWCKDHAGYHVANGENA